jgi:hypothetical protein
VTTTAILIFLVGLLLTAAFWVYLAVGVYHHHYPVSFIGWVSLVGDPILMLFLVFVLVSSRKY